MAIFLKKKQQLLQSLSSNFNFKFKWNTPSSWMSSVVPKRHVHTNKALLKECDYQSGSAYFRLTPENLSTVNRCAYWWLDGYQEFAPSCNGLFYVYNKSGEAGIWNVTIEEGIVLPAHAKSASCIVDACALGFDSTSQDYKVLRFCHNSVVKGNKYCWDEDLTSGVELYSFKTNSWKVLDHRDVFDFQSRSVYVKGCSYWVVDGSYILSFNFGDESFSCVGLPDTGHSKEWQGVDLVEFDGSLGCVVWSMYECLKSGWWGKRAFEVWVMKGDGLWSREVMVPPVECSRALGFLSNGVLLFEKPGKGAPLKVYDLCSNSFKDFHNITTYCGKMELFPYVESRVPMNDQLQV